MLSIFIPTQDRPALILRLLSYYAELGVKNQIIISDSSVPDKKLASSTIESLARTGLNIKYNVYSSGIPFLEKLLDTVKDVETKYCVLGGDDDFFIPEALNEAVQFLDTHPDYSVFHGEAISFSVDGEGDKPAFGRIAATSRYAQRAVEHASSSERLRAGLMDYATTWYSVHRSNYLLENLSRASNLALADYLFMELMLFSLDMIQGKAKKSNRLYMARQRRARKPTPLSMTQESGVGSAVFDWIISPGWSDHFDRIRSCLAEQIAEHDTMDAQEASLAVRDAFFSYFSYHMVLKPYSLTQRRGPLWKKSRGLYQLIERIPGVRSTWWALKILSNKIREISTKTFPDEMSTRALLNPSSPYHADFLPIYRAVSSLPAQDRRE